MNELVSFGAWVRSRRRALDLTQATLSTMVGCAEVTIRKIESDERRPSPVMASRLAEALRVPEADRDRFVRAGRAALSAMRLADPRDVGPQLLPTPVTSFLGRGEEMERALSLLQPVGGLTRLLTVTGPPGVGKTRFALELAGELGEKLDAPAAFVPLVAETDPTRVLRRVADRLGASTDVGGDVLAVLSAALGTGVAIIVLDNLEHLVSAASDIHELLVRCPGLTCLVTSRVPLGVADEFEFVLDGLDEATELFAERARAVSASFSTVDHHDVVAAICDRLDRLPLAVELAARRARWLSPAAILEELETGLGGLARSGSVDPRHRTMLEAVRWSYELLSPAAKLALRAISVAPGGITQRQLAAVLDDMPPPFGEILESSLVRLADERLSALQVVRDFVADIDDSTMDQLRRSYARVLLTELTAVNPGLVTTDTDVLDEIEREIDNADPIARWCLRDGASPEDIELGVGIVEAMGVWWVLRDRSRQGRDLAALALTRLPTPRPRLLYIEGETAWSSGDFATGEERFHAVVAQTDDPEAAAAAMGALGLLAMATGDLATAKNLLDRSRETLAQLSSPQSANLTAMTHLRAGLLAIHAGDLDEAERLHHVALAIASDDHNLWCTGTALGNLADLALQGGRVDDAIAKYHQSIGAFIDARSEWYAASRVGGLAAATAAAGDLEAAARLAGIGAGWLAQLGLDQHPLVTPNPDWDPDTVRVRLGDQAYEATWQEGFVAGRSALIP